MKQCPACKTAYTDDSLSFCLADGTALDSAIDEERTVVKRAGNNPLRVDIPAVAPLPSGKLNAKSAADSSGTWIKIVVAVLILGFIAIGAFGLIGAVFYYGTGGKEKEILTKSPTPTATVSATPDIEKERLLEEIANIDEQKLANTNTRPVSNDEDDADEQGSTITATVNSPKDGFLALRSIPDADRGERILRIPHGAEVEINNCEKARLKISGQTGRWCQVEYNGRTGWVFDAWLNY